MTGYAAQMAADTQFVGTPAISFLLEITVTATEATA